MSKECIFKPQTGFTECTVEWLGEYATQLCCAGNAEKITLLELMAVIINNTQIGDVAELVNYDAYKGEDPRIVKLLNILREKGIPIRTFDDGYLNDKEMNELRNFNIRDLIHSPDHK